jgi:hypothetical protein
MGDEIHEFRFTNTNRSEVSPVTMARIC